MVLVFHEWVDLVQKTRRTGVGWPEGISTGFSVFDLHTNHDIDTMVARIRWECGALVIRPVGRDHYSARDE